MDKPSMLTKMIQEEINNVLNESENGHKFKQVVKNSSFFGYESFTKDNDAEIGDSNIIVNWGIDFWFNESGIENLIVNVDSVEGTFTLKLYDKQTDEYVQETEKNITDFKWKFLVGDVNLQKNGSLYVGDLEFNFKNGVCTVNFS